MASMIDRSRGFAIVAAVLLVLSAIFFIALGLMALQVNGIVAQSPPQLKQVVGNMTGNVTSTFNTYGMVAILIGLVYVVAAVGVILGRWFGFISGLTMSGITIGGAVFIIRLVPFLLYIGLLVMVVPILIIIFLFGSWGSFGKQKGK